MTNEQEQKIKTILETLGAKPVIADRFKHYLAMAAVPEDGQMILSIGESAREAIGAAANISPGTVYNTIRNYTDIGALERISTNTYSIHPDIVKVLNGWTPETETRTSPSTEPADFAEDYLRYVRVELAYLGIDTKMAKFAAVLIDGRVPVQPGVYTQDIKHVISVDSRHVARNCRRLGISRVRYQQLIAEGIEGRLLSRIAYGVIAIHPSILSYDAFLDAQKTVTYTF